MKEMEEEYFGIDSPAHRSVRQPRRRDKKG
jgi:hypothetical protein